MANKFVNLFRGALGVACFVLVTPVIHASPIRDFRSPRIKYRVSTTCASALSSTRALGGPEDVKIAAQRFEDFRKNTLGGAPTTEDSFAVKATSHRVGRREELIRRAYGVERSFAAQGSEDAQIVAVAYLENDEQIQRFFSLNTTARETFVDQSYAAFRSKFWRRLISPLQLFSLLDLTQYSWVAGGMLTFAGVHFTMMTWLYSLHMTLTDFGNWRLLPLLATTGAFSAAGANDFPIRWVRSWEYGLDGLQNFFKRAFKRDRDWAYWSRDFSVSPEFVRELLQSKTIDWSVLEDEDYREMTSGLLRLRRYQERKAKGLENVHFSIDILASKTENGHEMSLVLRTMPRMSKRAAAAPSLTRGTLATELN